MQKQFVANTKHSTISAQEELHAPELHIIASAAITAIKDGSGLLRHSSLVSIVNLGRVGPCSENHLALLNRLAGVGWQIPTLRPGLRA